jgi:hypothetical protein
MEGRQHLKTCITIYSSHCLMWSLVIRIRPLCGIRFQELDLNHETAMLIAIRILVIGIRSKVRYIFGVSNDFWMECLMLIHVTVLSASSQPLLATAMLWMVIETASRISDQKGHIFTKNLCHWLLFFIILKKVIDRITVLLTCTISSKFRISSEYFVFLSAV